MEELLCVTEKKLTETIEKGYGANVEMLTHLLDVLYNEKRRRDKLKGE